jgi:hypothetical protein
MQRPSNWWRMWLARVHPQRRRYVASPEHPHDKDGIRLPIVWLHEFLVFDRLYRVTGIPRPCYSDNTYRVSDLVDAQMRQLDQTITEWQPPLPQAAG